MIVDWLNDTLIVLGIETLDKINIFGLDIPFNSVILAISLIAFIFFILEMCIGIKYLLKKLTKIKGGKK